MKHLLVTLAATLASAAALAQGGSATHAVRLLTPEAAQKAGQVVKPIDKTPPGDKIGMRLFAVLESATLPKLVSFPKDYAADLETVDDATYDQLNVRRSERMKELRASEGNATNG